MWPRFFQLASKRVIKTLLLRPVVRFTLPCTALRHLGTRGLQATFCASSDGFVRQHRAIDGTGCPVLKLAISGLSLSLTALRSITPGLFYTGNLRINPPWHYIQVLARRTGWKNLKSRTIRSNGQGYILLDNVLRRRPRAVGIFI